MTTLKKYNTSTSQWEYVLSGPEGPQGPAGPKGDTGNTSLVELTGTGFPEGVVTANVGTYYTDTSVTNGAIRWVKFSGIGNTGWRVLFGDTGIRRVWNGTTSEGINLQLSSDFSTVNQYITAGSIFVRRINDEVTYWVNDVQFTAGVPDVTLSWPTGFQMHTKAGVYPGAIYCIAHPAAPTKIDHWGSGGWRVSPSSCRWRDVKILQTAQAWPATLPGVAIA